MSKIIVGEWNATKDMETQYYSLLAFSQAELGQAKRTILDHPECCSVTVKIYTMQSVFRIISHVLIWFRIIENFHSAEFSAKRGRPSPSSPSLHSCLKDTLLTTFPRYKEEN
ncbi:hypothetical protein TNCV_3823031 [Trichonephila clavipes]|nr:hypothetical protein TNCV_3823031 [Trichonephila clavipes]